jgi:uncharacterized damage-inducible protein DinB
MYTTVDGFLREYEHESAETLKVFKALTDKSLAQPVAHDHRTLGKIAWHLAVTYPEMGAHAGITIGSLSKDAPAPDSAAKVVSAYEGVKNELIDFIKKNWKDANLTEVKNFYSMDWPVGLAMSILVRHEIHHRGQMTILMRQAGLKVPGVYGPAKEEWAGMGMQPPEE